MLVPEAHIRALPPDKFSIAIAPYVGYKDRQYDSVIIKYSGKVYEALAALKDTLPELASFFIEHGALKNNEVLLTMDANGVQYALIPQIHKGVPATPIALDSTSAYRVVDGKPSLAHIDNETVTITALIPAQRGYYSEWKARLARRW